MINDILSFLSHVTLTLYYARKKFHNPSLSRGGSRTAATSNMECFVTIVNGWKSLTIITKCSILDVAAVLDPPLLSLTFCNKFGKFCKNFKSFKSKGFAFCNKKRLERETDKRKKEFSVKKCV